MQKKMIWPVPVAIILGIGGALLRYIHFNFGYDEKGLPVDGLLTLSLTVFALAVTAIFLLTALLSGKRFSCHGSFDQAFTPVKKHGFYRFFAFISAIMALAGFILFMLSDAPGLTAVFKLIFVLLSACSFAFMALCGIYAGIPDTPRYLGYLGLMPALLCCFFLVYQYVSRAADPIVSEYSFQCVALASAAMFYITVSGYIFKKRQPKSAVFFGLMSTAFSITAMVSKAISLSWILIFTAIFLFSAVNTWNFTEGGQK